MAKNKLIQPIAVNQANNTRQQLHPHMELHKWKPGQSGNPNGRPLKALAQISIDKELGDQPCPEKIWKANRAANPWMLSARMDPAHLAAGRGCEKSDQGHVPHSGRCDGDRSLADG